MDFWTARIKPILNAVLEQRDAYTAGHCWRVGALAVALAQACSLSEHEVSLLRVVAQFHDIGKIGLPDAVLLKPGPLDADEWEIVKTHSARGEQIIRSDPYLPQVQEAALAIRHHHEYYDGRGYPDGLRGQAIPLLSRVISIVDSYDAMTTRRVYQASRSHDETMSILSSERGTKQDPEILDVFQSLDETWFKQLNMVSEIGDRPYTAGMP